MKKPFFSIVIPTLDEEKFVPQLLDDLVKQEEKSFEVVVVDGNSQDETVKTVLSYKKRLPLQLVQTNRSNVAYQRNLGAKKARGKYLVFLDADVRLPHTFLRLIKAAIDNTKQKLVTTYITSDSGDIRDELICILTNWGVRFSKFIKKPFIEGYDFIIERKLFFAIGGFNQKIVFGEDTDLSFRLYKIGYSPLILTEPKLIYSLRRHYQEGRLKTIWRLTTSAVYQLIHGTKNEKFFDYPMGGGWYIETKK